MHDGVVVNSKQMHTVFTRISDKGSRNKCFIYLHLCDCSAPCIKTRESQYEIILYGNLTMLELLVDLKRDANSVLR